MADILRDQCESIEKKLNAQGWPVCGQCKKEFMRLKPSGFCGECEWHLKRSTREVAPQIVKEPQGDKWLDEIPGDR